MSNFNANTESNQSRTDEYNQIIKRLTEFHKEPTVKLINHLRDTHKYSLDEIASVIGVSKQAISTNYLLSGQNGDNSNKTFAKSKTISRGGKK